MSRAVHDQFIDDDEEETCPLCVEEFDLTDQGFRPCPCGYQVRFDPSQRIATRPFAPPNVELLTSPRFANSVITM